MVAKEIANELYKTALFKGIERLEEHINAFPPTCIKLAQGERYVIKNSLSLLVSGKINIVKEFEGRDAYMKTVNTTALLGLATLFADEEEYISTLVAKSSVSLLLFSEEFVKTLIMHNPHFSLRLVTLLCKKVRYLNRRIDFYTCSRAEEKVREFLSHTANCEGEVVMSMSELSKTLDIARASLYRAVNSLEEKGYIAKDGKKITLLK